MRFTGQVVRVSDGDTIVVASHGFETRVRLVGIDTPEVYGPRVECGAREASAATKALLPAGVTVTVTVTSDPTQAVRDRYGRILGFVYAGARAGTPVGSVNYRLVADGLAYTYIYRGLAFSGAAAFLAAQKRAVGARRGVWGAPCWGRR